MLKHILCFSILLSAHCSLFSAMQLVQGKQQHEDKQSFADAAKKLARKLFLGQIGFGSRVQRVTQPSPEYAQKQLNFRQDLITLIRERCNDSEPAHKEHNDKLIQFLQLESQDPRNRRMLGTCFIRHDEIYTYGQRHNTPTNILYFGLALCGTDVCAAMINAGADINLPDPYWSPLLRAIGSRHLFERQQKIALLVAQKANVNQSHTARTHETPLDCAVRWDDASTVKLLLDARATIRENDDLLCHTTHREIIRALILAKADIYAKGWIGKNCLTIRDTIHDACKDVEYRKNKETMLSELLYTTFLPSEFPESLCQIIAGMAVECASPWCKECRTIPEEQIKQWRDKYGAWWYNDPRWDKEWQRITEEQPTD